MTFIELSRIWDGLNTWAALAANAVLFMAYTAVALRAPKARVFGVMLSCSALLLGVAVLGQLLMLNSNSLPWPVHVWRTVFVIRSACQSVGLMFAVVGTYGLYLFIR